MKLRPPFKIHGGKYYGSPLVIGNFPKNYEEMNYLELFGGAGSVLLNKKPSPVEIYNDLYQPTANVFHCLVNSPKEIIDCINSTKYELTSFENAQKGIFSFGTVESAVNEIILRRMSRGGMKTTFSWSNRTRGGQPGDVNAWETFKELLPVICQRLRNVNVQSKNAVDLIVNHSTDVNALFYLDPPYVLSTRTAKKVYEYEMTDKDHEKLADICKSVKGKVAISGYDSDLYRKLYSDWRWVKKDMPNNSGQGKVKQRRIECVIMNY